jgi:UDP-GlcNAc:undecaprenyl-phosphate GlcNAc-1-phosphate transferase
LLLFVLAFLASVLVTPATAFMAAKMGWVSHSVNLQGKHPSLLGGPAVLVSMLIALLSTSMLPAGTVALPFWGGLGLIVTMGLVDDFRVLKPRAKLIIQIISAFLFLIWWLHAGRISNGFWAPLYFFWLLGITNGLNLLDNMDGLAPGVGAIASLFLALVLFDPAPTQSAAFDWGRPVLLSLSGALTGFVVFNFPPARIYLGDSGSHLAGFSLAALSLAGIHSSSTPASKLYLPVLILAIPILDTTFVTISRLQRRIPVSQGGKDHLSHTLLGLGMTETKVALLFYFAALVFGIVASLAAPPG